MTYDDWLPTVPAQLTRDATDYRLARYVGSVAWDDVVAIEARYATRSIADQLYRALGSICANLSEA